MDIKTNTAGKNTTTILYNDIYSLVKTADLVKLKCSDTCMNTFILFLFHFTIHIYLACTINNITQYSFITFRFFF